jgi:hypothetical protein
MTWGDVFRRALRRGEDHGSAAYRADEWERRQKKDPPFLPIQGPRSRERAIWLRREGDRVIVEVEDGERWVEVISECHDSFFSHIIEPVGVERLLGMARASSSDEGAKR